MQNPANRNFDPQLMDMIHNVLTLFSPYSATLRNMAEIERRTRTCQDGEYTWFSCKYDLDPRS